MPPPSPRLVARPRLIEHLNEGLVHGNKLTIISAPVGSGKTTLVSSWLFSLNRPFSWLSLDAGDNDSVRFWSYLIASLQSFQADLGHTLLNLLQTAETAPIENLLIDLINQITTLEDKIVLVIDDYHIIETDAIHQGINFLISHMPPQLHLVLTTREDPPIFLAQLRARGQMTEIRAADLRFTRAETTEFFRKSAPALNLAQRDIDILDRRTEGWAAGLQLAALSLQNAADPSAFVTDFAGDDRFIVDYLIGEVIERQPADIRDFLLKTAFLDRFTAPLCNTVTGRDDGQECLTSILQANLFLIPLDNRREWYRYHQLFADLLRYQIKESIGVEGVTQLHLSAAIWYAQHGYTDEAISHYLESGAFEQAADLIESVIITLIVQGHLRKVLTWLAQLPDDLTYTRPLLCVSKAWVLNVTGEGTAANPWLEAAEQGLLAFPMKQNRKVRSLISIVRAYFTRNQGNIPQSIQYLRQSLAEIESDDFIVRSSVNLNLGFNYSILGELALAEQALQAALLDGQVGNAVYLNLLGMATQGRVYIAQGKLYKAARTFQEAIAYGKSQNNGHPFPPAGYAYAGLGQVLYEQDNLAAAEQFLSQAVEFGELMGDWSMKRRGLLPLAWLKQMQGDRAAAQDFWQRALNVVHQAESSRIENQLMVHRVRLWLAQAAWYPVDPSALNAAAAWSASYQNQQPDEIGFQDIFAQTTLAWVELALGQVDQAMSRLEGLAETAHTHGWNDILINVLALKALACVAQGKEETALEILEITLEKAVPEGYFRSLVDYGPPMQDLLHIAASVGIWPDTVPKLLAAFPQESVRKAPRTGKPPLPQVLVDPLTDRELDILNLMAAGLSHHEIASELYLSVNTVKWHASHVYSKLGVNRRTQAVARAQKLGII